MPVPVYTRTTQDINRENWHVVEIVIMVENYSVIITVRTRFKWQKYETEMSNGQGYNFMEN